MTRTIHFLDPAQLLVQATVTWLCGTGAEAGHVRTTPEGAHSLEHVMIVVPTAQAGRSLRLALAEEATQRGWGGILPPRVVESMQLIASTDETRATASPLLLRAHFLAFMTTSLAAADYPHLMSGEISHDARLQLAFLDQLSDIWRILARGGLTMADVPNDPRAQEVLAEALGDETIRWHEMAAFETAFFSFLHAHGLRHEAEDIRATRTQARPLPSDIDLVVLPALADPISVLYDVLAQQRDTLHVAVLIHARSEDAARYDDWGRPNIDAWTGEQRPILNELRDADILRFETDTEMARHVAADFPPVQEERRRPSLGLCDATLYPELAGAFLNAGYLLHNPGRHQLAASSLGRILANLVDLWEQRKNPAPWPTFIALLREDDVLRSLLSRLKDVTRKDVLQGLDICQNAFLPLVLPANGHFDLTRLMRRDQAPAACFEAAALHLVDRLTTGWQTARTLHGFVRHFLQDLYVHRRLTGKEGEREFRAAITCVQELLTAANHLAATGLALSEHAAAQLFRKALQEATYDLEPESTHVLRTEGWLELAWSTADKIALVGFAEGAVPDSVVGHSFLPDRLREALGLTCNARRLARDTMLLCDIVRARAACAGSVRAYVSASDAAGNLRRPSRLLFLVARDDLARRVGTLFRDLPPGEVRTARIMSEAWRPRLPMGEMPLPGITPQAPDGRLSASAIDQWLKCPFSYLFKYALAMRRTEVKEELGPDDFGTFVHKTLECYALEQLARTAQGREQLTDEAEIAAALRAHLTTLRAAYGTAPALRLKLQLDAVEGRLVDFARLQAQWAAEGWRIAAQPEYRFNVRPFASEPLVDLPFRGSIDRIDYKEGAGYRIIDYKTWDRRAAAMNHILCGGQDQVAHAQRLHLPLLAPLTPKGSARRFLSVQLLLYARCLACAEPETFAGKIVDCCYVLLGRNAENTCVLGSAFDHGDFEAVKRGKIPLIEHLALALDTTRTAIRRIRAGIFWPCGPTDELKYDVKDLLSTTPERDFPLGTPWRDEQERRIAALETEEARA